MAKAKRYPYGDIPTVDTVKEYRERKRIYSGIPLPPMNEEPSNPLEAMKEEMEGLYHRYHDWYSVYAFMNID